jgi:23S rRNA (cytosine1962-C5)-methyltransferase
MTKAGKSDAAGAGPAWGTRAGAAFARAGRPKFHVDISLPGPHNQAVFGQSSPDRKGRKAMATLVLYPGKEKSLRQHHPWVFSGALESVPGGIAPGETVDVVSSKRAFLARGAFSPHSQISVRAWTFDPEEPVDPAFFRSRLERSIRRRKERLHQPLGAVRLVNAESDGLPGLVVDRYADFLVVQCLSAGIELWKAEIVRALLDLIPCQGILERSDAEVRFKEGLKPMKGVMAGDSPPALVEIREGKARFLVDIVNGHKTGFYLDQQENRSRMLLHAGGAEVLNCFAYTGGFGIFALLGGAAHLTSVEISGPTAALLEKNLALNAVDPAVTETLQADVFSLLRTFRDKGRVFDLIVLDPPKFADSRRQMNRALRGYKDINWLAFRLLKPGGVLVTFSCSGLVEPSLFQKVVADAALDARREARIITSLTQAPDHPVGLNFPEGLYLKGFVCQAD